MINQCMIHHACDNKFILKLIRKLLRQQLLFLRRENIEIEQWQIDITINIFENVSENSDDYNELVFVFKAQKKNKTPTNPNKHI